MVEPSREPAHLAEIAVIKRNVPVGRDRLAYPFDRDRRIAGLMRNDAEEMKRLGMAGHGIEDPPAQLLGGRKTPGLAMLLGKREGLWQRQRLLRMGEACGRTDIAHASASEDREKKAREVSAVVKRNIRMKLQLKARKGEALVGLGVRAS